MGRKRKRERREKKRERGREGERRERGRDYPTVILLHYEF
jgi:hypothetical protein